MSILLIFYCFTSSFLSASIITIKARRRTSEYFISESDLMTVTLSSIYVTLFDLWAGLHALFLKVSLIFMFVFVR